MDVPAHIGIILDGNRRWAKQHGLSALEGHQAGVDALKRAAERALDWGVKELSVFAFSSQNWKRSQEEVDGLMDVFRWLFNSQIEELHENNIRVRVVGSRTGIPQDLGESIQAGEEQTKDNTRGTVNLLLNYGGRSDITQAVSRIVARDIDPEEVTEDTVSGELSTAGMGDVDLLIRTSEYRLSGFLPWESVYAEICFQPDILWPDYDGDALDAAITFYQNRQRRFGA
jgi:undecaprenyl diphosphate synthase